MTKLITLALTYCLLWVTTTAHATLYRWVDENGKVIYSDKLPPKASNLGHSELNKQGTTLKVAPRAKTEAERTAEKERLALEQQRISALKAQEASEQSLLDMYASVDDLVKFYDQRLSLQKTNLTQLRDTRAKLAANLILQREKLAKTEDQEQRQLLTQFITVGEADVARYDKAIDQGLVDAVKINQQYELDKQRLTDLLKGKSVSVSTRMQSVKP